MNSFDDFKIKNQLINAITELGFEKPTPIQRESYSPILSGSDFVGIAQTGTGKTIAYLLPILQDLKFSDQPQPRVVVLVPTRALVLQIVEQIEKLTPYLSIRVVGVHECGRLVSDGVATLQCRHAHRPFGNNIH